MLAIGDRTVLAVSVVANDASTTSSIEQIANFTFGTGGDPVNLVSQYSACSYNKLRFVPTTDSRTTNGVYKVAINMSVIGVGDIPVENAIISALTTQFGVLSSKFNHVMICFPPGTSGSWIAYGYYNHYLTLFNDQMCNFVSVQMHEIGHNLNLDHSGEGGIEYADQSGMMGYSYLYSDIPIMCFNGAKSWQLGWYIDRQSIATPLTSQWQGQLVGISDYGISNISQAVLIKVETTTLDYYIGYNRKRGINSETQMGGNQVMITTRIPGTGAAPSSLIKMLSAGQDYVISNFNGSGKNVIIRVNSIDTTSVSTSAAAVADVMITIPTEQSSTAQPTAPTVSPTAQPTSVPTVSPTAEPTAMPTVSPTAQPSTAAPTTAQPTAVLTISPTAQPTAGPTPNPTAKPTARPTTLAPIQSSCMCEAYTSSQRCRGGCGGNGVCNWISRTCKQVLAY
jgi:Gametolysin peptidase M11